MLSALLNSTNAKQSTNPIPDLYSDTSRGVEHPICNHWRTLGYGWPLFVLTMPGHQMIETRSIQNSQRTECQTYHFSQPSPSISFTTLTSCANSLKRSQLIGLRLSLILRQRMRDTHSAQAYIRDSQTHRFRHRNSNLPSFSDQTTHCYQ